MPVLNLLDLAFLVIISVSVLLGFIKGLVRQLLAIFFLILGLILAFIFYPDLSSVLLRRLRDPMASDFAAFLAILLATILLGFLLTLLVKKVIVIGPLKSIDRLLGAFFGLLRGLILSAVLIAMIFAFQFQIDLVRKSRLAPFITTLVSEAVSLLPGEIQQRITAWFYHGQKKESTTQRSI